MTHTLTPRAPMLTPEAFARIYGTPVASSLTGARWIGSALTRRYHIYYDHAIGQYVREPRQWR